MGVAPANCFKFLLRSLASAAENTKREIHLEVILVVFNLSVIRTLDTDSVTSCI